MLSPKPGAKDPYTGAKLKAPFPGVVLTPGSIQGSQGMYRWLAEDLAERGYVVLSYDVQGQGTSETFPHQTGTRSPFCNPFSAPEPTEMTGCPGFPFQQSSNFVKGTEDATDFFFSTPKRARTRTSDQQAPRSTPSTRSGSSSTAASTRSTATKGRTTRFAIIGHSLGAVAVSQVQGTDKRVAAVVALDKLQGGDRTGGDLTDVGEITPRCRRSAVQSEYGFTVSPAALSGGAVARPTTRRSCPSA